ncbi:hypothetical protein L484_002746 [Morus notabilis]|uniref:Uncharacterized protein n=1 Tax=Morus notabilis TaxID=981085 RepID=W9QBK9_9ROSA|nr:hypothetical protein L484_002746 [Morus notabilis]
MANDAALRSAFVWLAGVVLVVGICTFSFKKMVATYVVGAVRISGVFLTATSLAGQSSYC